MPRPLAPREFTALIEAALAAPAAAAASAGGVWVRVSGHSMVPFLYDGERALVQRRGVSLGDVLVYRSEAGATRAHRVVGANEGAWLVRGDHPDAVAEVVAFADALGVVVRRRLSWWGRLRRVRRALRRFLASTPSGS